MYATPAKNGHCEPIVITGIGMIASVGANRESVWRAVRSGQSGVRSLRGLVGIPDGLLIGAPVDIPPDYPGQLKVITLAQSRPTRRCETPASTSHKSISTASAAPSAATWATRVTCRNTWASTT